MKRFILLAALLLASTTADATAPTIPDTDAGYKAWTHGFAEGASNGHASRYSIDLTLYWGLPQEDIVRLTACYRETFRAVVIQSLSDASLRGNGRIRYAVDLDQERHELAKVISTAKWKAEQRCPVTEKE